MRIVLLIECGAWLAWYEFWNGSLDWICVYDFSLL
jgi:hypothetical protein